MPKTVPRTTALNFLSFTEQPHGSSARPDGLRDKSPRTKRSMSLRQFDQIHAMHGDAIQLIGVLRMRGQVAAAQQEFAVEIKFRARVAGQIEIARIHADRIFGTGFHAQAAEAAAQKINFERERVFFDAAIGRFTGGDVNAFVWAGRFAHHARYTARRSVGTEHQTMQPAPARRNWPLLFGIENRDARRLRLHPERAAGVASQVREKVPAGDHESLP